MPRLNVRCCCQPTKVLGTLPVPDGLANREGRFRVWLYEAMHPWMPEHSEAAFLPTGEMYTIEVRKLCLGSGKGAEYAVHSEERPIELWRKIRGFEEA